MTHACHIDVEQEEKEDKYGEKLGFKKIKIDFDFTTEEISLPPSTSSCRDGTQSKYLQCKI